MPHDQHKSIETVKAGALLCPSCCVEFREIQADIEINGKVLHNVKILQCPICKEEVLTSEQFKNASSKDKDES